MFRYLSQAFWARPRIGILGRIPINALAVAGAIILGFGEHAVWLGGAGVEALYLYALSTNPRFQRWVEERKLAQLGGETDDARDQLMRSLGGAARQRVIHIQEKIGKIETLYRDSRSEDFLFDANRDALQKLMWAFMKLLVAQRNLQNLGNQTTAAEIDAQIAAIENELKGNVTSTLRDSKSATLNILRQRSRNLQRRGETLAEIDADLARVEAQIDLALEQASMKDRPTAISANIDLVSHMLEGDYASELGETTQIDSRRELEN